MVELSSYDEGLIVGILISHGSFGGDGRQPQVSLKLHVRHQNLLEWLVSRLPDSRLYGPYNHGNRNYFQWSIRGRALAEHLVPLLERHITQDLDEYAFGRLETMKNHYAKWFR